MEIKMFDPFPEIRLKAEILSSLTKHDCLLDADRNVAGPANTCRMSC